MARPMKNNCDYFPHDSGMRNHKKLKAIRSTFGIEGYALWCMMLEHITGSDFNSIPYNELEIELIAGDFGVESTKLIRFIEYCLKIGILQRDGERIRSESLDERLAPVYEKRGFLKKKRRSEYVSDSETVVSVPESTQIKEKEIKGKEIKVNEIINPFGDSMAFGQIWEEWEEYRKQKRAKLTPISVKHQIKFLSGFSESEAIQIIKQSIQNGWTGLFELKNKNNGKRTLKDSANLINNYFEGGNS
jgi:hypothetical protein